MKSGVIHLAVLRRSHQPGLLTRWGFLFSATTMAAQDNPESAPRPIMGGIAFLRGVEGDSISLDW